MLSPSSLGGAALSETDPVLIELKISHYGALLKLRLTARKRTIVEQLLGEARRDLVWAKSSRKRRADVAVQWSFA